MIDRETRTVAAAYFDRLINEYYYSIAYNIITSDEPSTSLRDKVVEAFKQSNTYYFKSLNMLVGLVGALMLHYFPQSLDPLVKRYIKWR